MAILDMFRSQKSIEAPSNDFEAITPANSDLRAVTRFVYVGSAGTLIVQPAKGGDPVTINSAGGQYHPIRVSQIRTGGTAGGIIAFY